MQRLKKTLARIPALATTLALAFTLALVPTALAGHHTHGSQPGDIVEVAVEAGSFETLVAAVQAAGLVETLQGDGPFTVFAPTDEAFAALPDGTVESLLKPENKDKLVAILTYHVVPGNVKAAAASQADSATTVQGSDVRLKVDSHGTLRVDDAKVVSADVMASNGVIHVIDTVLMPN